MFRTVVATSPFLLGAFAASDVEVFDETLCGAGKYASDGACLQCPFGKYSDEQNAKPCAKCAYLNACPSGKHRDNRDAGCNCHNCPPGRFNGEASDYNYGEVDCEVCPKGKFAPEPGEHEHCIECSPGKTSHAGAWHCTTIKRDRIELKTEL